MNPTDQLPSPRSHRIRSRAVKNSRITKKTFKTLLVEQLVNNSPSSSSIGHTNTLLHNVGTELLGRQGRNVAEELTNNRFDETVVVEIENVLNDVVALLSLMKRSKVSESAARRGGQGDRNARKHLERG